MALFQNAVIFISYLFLAGFFADNESLVKISGSGAVPSPCSAATIAAVNSKLYLFGGLSNDSGWLADFHVFDIGQKLTHIQKCFNYCVVTAVSAYHS